MLQEVSSQYALSYTIVLQRLLNNDSKSQLILAHTLKAQICVIKVILELCVEVDRLSKGFLSEDDAKPVNASYFMV